jgi:hypothetical protein
MTLGDWVLKEENGLRATRRFTTKEDATSLGGIERALGDRGGLVRIHTDEGAFDEERTYPSCAAL